MTDNARIARLEKREAELTAAIDRHENMTTTERQLLAAHGIKPKRLEDDLDERSTTERQVARRQGEK